MYLFSGKPFIVPGLSRIGYLPEYSYYFWYLTSFEKLGFLRQDIRIPSRARKERIMELLKLVDLTGNEHTMVKAFSKGMLQKVSFAQALINDPDLLILDEPTTGLDPIAKMNMRDILIDLKKKGKTIFFSSHELSEVEVISDKVVIMKNGKILKEAAPKKILDEKGQHLSLEQYFFNLVRNS
jgi:ABC-2 type transport system ATP-binding protein